VGAWLAEQRLAHAAIDVSDGVSGDVRHICEQSHVGIMLEDAALPISPALEAYAGMSGEPAARWALAGGEDYELLFTASSRVRRDIMKGAARLGFSITRIGRIVPASQRKTLRLSNGRLLPLPRLGYEHFGDNARMGLSRA
jgi:thiamine-monophosphate kinase